MLTDLHWFGSNARRFTAQTSTDLGILPVTAHANSKTDRNPSYANDSGQYTDSIMRKHRYINQKKASLSCRWAIHDDRYADVPLWACFLILLSFLTIYLYSVAQNKNICDILIWCSPDSHLRSFMQKNQSAVFVRMSCSSWDMYWLEKASVWILKNWQQSRSGQSHFQHLRYVPFLDLQTISENSCKII